MIKRPVQLDEITAAGGQAAASCFGVGQTQQDVTASRAFGTTYTNTTGRPIFVSVSGSVSVTNISLTISGVVAAVAQPGSSTIVTVTGVVLPGETYSATYAGTLNKWSERR